MENKDLKNLKNLTRATITKGLTYTVKKSEQQRTTEKKKEFIEIMDKAMGVARIACDTVGISRQTYYNWIDEDPEFRAEINRIKREQLGEVEDRLLRAIIKDEGWAIKMYLDRVHPKYRPKQENYNIPTEKTLEDLLDDDEKNIKEKQEDYDKRNDNKNVGNGDKATEKNEPGTNREAIKDTKQEGPSSTVQAKQSAEVLPRAEDAPKPNTESAPKGD